MLQNLINQESHERCQKTTASEQENPCRQLWLHEVLQAPSSGQLSKEPKLLQPQDVALHALTCSSSTCGSSNQTHPNRDCS